jgi:spore coat protein A
MSRTGSCSGQLPEGVTAPQSYVYHCHILEHEDNDMMRPFIVSP